MPISRGRRWRGFALVAALAGALAACGSEAPLEIGPDLSPVEVTSFEVIIPNEAFMDGYRTVPGFLLPWEVGYAMIATDVNGDVDFRTLARFPAPPRRVNYVDDQGITRPDTMPTFPSGRLIVVADTLLSGDGSVTIALYRTTEAWDAATANWEMRIDSVGEREAWSTPGGALVELVSRASFSPQVDDSLSLPVDSLTIALWADTANPARGAILVSETPGARVRVNELILHLSARPSERPDTLVDVLSNPTEYTFIGKDLDPEPGTMRVGGMPAWRSFIRFADGFDTLRVCRTPDRCHRLSEVSINYAALVVRPTTPPSRILPEDTLHIQARAISVSPNIPLERSPLLERLNPFAKPTVAFAPDDFDVPAGAIETEIPITTFIGKLATLRGAPEDARHVALVTVPEGGLFGHAVFQAEGPFAPTLRVVVSVMEEKRAQ